MRNFKHATKAAKTAALGTTALTVMLFASSGAWAQNCTSTPLRGGFLELGGLAASTASSVAASIGNANTAFLAQQGSAFVSAPGNAPPGSPGGGVWVRGVGGVVETTTTSVTAANQIPVLNAQIDSGTINCSNRERATFAGVQVGQDISRLNIDGWNLHLGTTAGFLESRASELEGAGTFKTNVEVPFIGTYAVATKGGFFADAMLRREFYNIELNEPTLNLHNQPFGARGLSLSANAGYQVQLPNNWFIEPSAGLVWSRTDVDSFSGVGLPITGLRLSGTFSVDDIESKIGRATVRFGTSFTAGNLGLQPFGSLSVFREFGGDVTSRYVTCPSCAFVDGTPVQASFDTSSSRLGTWGQASLGIAGQVLNTGWLGFVRGDYRFGENIEGWTGNAGLRYQFMPEPVPVVGKGIYKAPPVPVVVPVSWTGFYVGGFFGTAYGKTDYAFVGTTTASDPRISGWIGGGQVGYNYQINRVVLGLEGDIGATNAHGSKTCGSLTGLERLANGTNPFGDFSPFFLTCSNDLDWVATLAGRLGVTWDRTLLYVKAGGAWTRDNPSYGCILGPTNPALGTGGVVVRGCFNPAGALTNGASATETRAGLMLGFGTEFALTQNWSAKAEYNFMRFGEDDVRLSDGTLINVRDDISIVKVGVNYRFGPAAAPVVAKY